MLLFEEKIILPIIIFPPLLFVIYSIIADYSMNKEYKEECSLTEKQLEEANELIEELKEKLKEAKELTNKEQ